MTQPACEPLIISAEMSQYGYWVVTVSVEPGLRLSIMICRVGITQQQARELACQVTPAYPATRRRLA